MTQSPESALIRYRIDEARDTLDDIQLLLTHGRLRAAANRIYYAAFYAALAALLTKGLQFSKHSAVITFFDKEFVKTGILPREYSKSLHKAFQERQDDDYMPFVELDEQELKELFEDVQVMVKGIQNYVESFLEEYT